MVVSAHVNLVAYWEYTSYSINFFKLLLDMPGMICLLFLYIKTCHV